MAINDSEMNRMQQDAIRRVREMQARAMQYQSGTQPEPRRSDTHPQQMQQRQPSPPARNGSVERRDATNSHSQHPTPRQGSASHTESTPHTQPDSSNPHTASEPAPSGRETANAGQHPAQVPRPQQTASIPPAMVRPANPVTDIFQMLFRESDRTLLLALILILSEEKSDPGLLFALLYIAL